MLNINMLSKADSVRGHWVLSAHDEQVDLVRNELSKEFRIYENTKTHCDINHYHTINLRYFLSLPFAKMHAVTVGYVHFLPETLENSIHLPFFMQKIFYKYVIAFYKSMDYLVTVNPAFIDKLSDYGIDESKIKYIPNFVSSDKFYKIENFNTDRIKNKYKIPLKKFTVISVGQLQKRKGVLEFIDLAFKMPEVQFVWVGGFSFKSISEGYNVINKAMENPPKNVKFIGMVERSCMNELYNMADVMFQPSFEELFPMTILEAMSCEVPMLLRDLDEYVPILNGYYLKGNSTEDFKNIIEQLQNEIYYQNASAISKKGSSFYSKESIKQIWKEYYLNLIDNKEIKYKNKFIFNKNMV